MKTIIKITVLSSLIAFTACKKKTTDPDPTTASPTTGALNIAFENKVGNQALVLNTTKYTQNYDTFTVKTFNYYISNIKLTATDGSVYSETESYHLMKATNTASLSFNLSNIPVKNYSSITFMIGVDSLRNVSGSQTGALDPVNGEFWSWNSGYIMAKLEGTSPQSGDAAKNVQFHIGGFSGTNNVLKTVILPFTTNATVNGTKTPQVKIKADVAEWFAPNMVSFGSMYNVTMPGAMAKKIADNYANMFTVTQVIN